MEISHCLHYLLVNVKVYKHSAQKIKPQAVTPISNLSQCSVHIFNLSTKLFPICKALSKFPIFTKAIIAQSKLVPRVQGESYLSHSNDVTYPIIIGGLGLVLEDSPFIIAQEKLKCLDKL